MRIIPVKLPHFKASVPCSVDDKDYEMLSKHKWCQSQGYAVSNLSRKTHKKRRIRMHQILMNTPKGMHTDHIDGNPINNQKSNLRVCTASQNLMNRGRTRINRSGFKGVSWHKVTKKWQARIKVKRKEMHLGYFKIPEAASEAYKEAAKKYHGEFYAT